SSHSFIFRITASTPYKRLWFSSIGNHSISGLRVSRNASVSFSSAQRHRRTSSTFCSEIRVHLPANCAFSSVVGDGGYVVMISPPTSPTPPAPGLQGPPRDPRRTPCRRLCPHAR